MHKYTVCEDFVQLTRINKEVRISVGRKGENCRNVAGFRVLHVTLCSVRREQDAALTASDGRSGVGGQQAMVEKAVSSVLAVSLVAAAAFLYQRRFGR